MSRAASRVNWLVRQLKNAPENVRVEAFTAHSRGGSSAELLGVVRENPAVLLTDPSKELRTFRIALDRPLGAKRGRGRGSFIDSVLDAVEDFYAEVLQHIRAWTAAPPKVRDTAEEPAQPVPPALVSTALSSQDGAEEVDGLPGAHVSREEPALGPMDGVDGRGETTNDPGEGDATDVAPPQWATAAADLADAENSEQDAGVGADDSGG